MADIDKVKRNIGRMIDGGANEQEIDQYLSLEGVSADQLRQSKTVSLEQSMDAQRGAPASVRATVGPGYRGLDDRLATLRKYYPDAQPYDEDNFVFTDPQSGRPTLYNPKGMDVGDWAEQGRAAAEIGGGVVGGVAGAVASTPTGFTSAPVMVPVAGGLGAEAGGQLYDLFMQWLGNRVDTRGAVQRTADAAVGVGANAVGQKLGAEIPAFLKRTYGGVRNKLAGASGQELIRAFSQNNIPLEGAAGAITGSSPVQGVSHALSVMPTSSNIMTRHLDDTLNAVAQMSDDVTAKYGKARTIEEGGRALQKGTASFVEAFKSKAGQLYGDLGQHIKGDDVVDLGNTIKALKGPLDKFSNAQNIGKSLVPAKFQGFLDDIAANNGKLSWEQVKELRSFVGNMADDPRVITDIPKAQWKQLYGALSLDLETLARTKGPEAYNAFARANNYYRAGAGRIEKLEGIINSKNAETAFNAALSGSKSGGSMLRALRRSVPDDMWDDFVAAKLSGMGLATPGAQSAAGDAFSVNTFLTNWNKLSPEAKDALFRGGRYKTLAKELDDLTKIVGSLKDAEKMRNFSGTAQQNLYMQLAQGGLGGAVGYQAGGPEGAVYGAGMGLGLPYATAKLMTNPRFVRWLAQGVQIAPTNYNSLSAHLGRLATITKLEPEIKGEIEQYLQSMRSAYEASPRNGNQTDTHPQPRTAQ